MERANVGGSKHITEEGRNTSESTAVTRGQDPDGHEEGPVAAGLHDGGEAGENDSLTAQHDHVRVLATDTV